MSEEKKTKSKTTAKKVAPAKVKPKTEVENEVVEDVVIEKPVAKKRVIGNDDEIVVMNNTTGRYGYKGRSGFSMEMSDYGDTLEIPFAELKRMRSEQKRHIEEAFIVILDEDVVKELRYEKLYENVVDEDGVNDLLRNPDKLDSILPKMPLTMRETIGAIATRKYRNDELHDIRILKAIETHLGVKIDV